MGTVTMGTMGGIRISWMGKKRSAGWMGWVDGMGGMGGIPIGTMGKGGVGREGTGRPEMGEISSTPSQKSNRQLLTSTYYGKETI